MTENPILHTKIGNRKIKYVKLDKPRLIAEDLGEITSDVERLRNSVEMPGMKVLQFAFGADLPSSPNAPHNFESTNCFVYTGTR